MDFFSKGLRFFRQRVSGKMRRVSKFFGLAGLMDGFWYRRSCRKSAHVLMNGERAGVGNRFFGVVAGVVFF